MRILTNLYFAIYKLTTSLPLFFNVFMHFAQNVGQLINNFSKTFAGLPHLGLFSISFLRQTCIFGGLVKIIQANKHFKIIEKNQYLNMILNIQVGSNRKFRPLFRTDNNAANVGFQVIYSYCFMEVDYRFHIPTENSLKVLNYPFLEAKSQVNYAY